MKHKRHNYAKGVLREFERAESQGKLKPGTVHIIHVRHDSYCDLLNNRGPCNCRPDISQVERIPSPNDN